MNVYEAFIWMRVQVCECASGRGGGGAGGVLVILSCNSSCLGKLFHVKIEKRSRLRQIELLLQGHHQLIVFVQGAFWTSRCFGSDDEGCKAPKNNEKSAEKRLDLNQQCAC
jgi:hypothetical protein